MLISKMQKKIFITGSAGFIGFHLSKRLLQLGYNIIGIDNLNDYYDPRLKQSRLEILQKSSKFTFYKLDLNDPNLQKIFQDHKPEIVINLAAQAGVRYSIKNPMAYIHSNISGFVNLLESLKSTPPKHFIYASSSSVYGVGAKAPFSTAEIINHPVSLYAATKASNELMGHVYSHMYKIPATALRFFTVYGSWGRPDMAYWSFTEKILNSQTIDLFNYGNLRRDFTHISDIIESIHRLLDIQPKVDPISGAPHQILNIGASSPVELEVFLQQLETVIGKKAVINKLPMQAGDVYETYADVSALEEITKYKPKVALQEGLQEFFSWYKLYFKI